MHLFLRSGRLVLAAVMACLLPIPAILADTAAPQKVATVEGITEYRLANGLRVLLFPDPATPKVTVNLTVFVGSRHEGYGETGMAHLLEHMVFKGTPQHPDVPKALRDHGAQFNGTTWVDRTNYFETMNGTDANLEFGIRLEADRMVNSFVRREDLLSEMTVVRNEFERGENDPGNVLSQRMMAVAYEWHNYGKSTIGNRSDIERVPIDRLREFYKKYYQPDNAMLVIAGKFDPAKAMAYVQKYFGALPKPERELDSTYTEEPAQDGERTVVLRRVGKVGVVGVIYHISAGAHPDFAATEVLANILDAPPSGRLYEALVKTKKATSVNVGAFGWHDPGVLEIAAQVDGSSSVEAVRDAIIEQLEQLKTKPVTAEEVNRAKRQLLKQREQLMADSNRIGVTLSDWGAKGDWRLFYLHRDRLEKVTPADIMRVAERYLQASNRTVGLYIPSDKPERTVIPPTPVVADLVKDYKSTQAVAEGEAFDPTPENIEKRLQRSQLPSGVKVALLPKKTRGARAVIELTLRYGNLESLKGYESAANILPRLMLRGTKKHTYQQIQDELDSLGASLRASGTTGSATFTLDCKRDTLPKALDLLGEVLREPTFPAEEFDVIRRQSREGLLQGQTEPQMVASVTLFRKLSPYPKGDVRYSTTYEEAIERLDALKLEQIKKLYEEQFNGQHGELVAIGDFDVAPVTAQFTEMLRDWKPKVAYERIGRDTATHLPGGRVTHELPDKANAVYMAGLNLAVREDDPDYAALEVANYLFGGGTLSSRLGNRVRQKEGLSYGVRSHLSAGKLDRHGWMMIMAICNPTNMTRLDEVIAEEIAKVLKEGVGEKELADAKQAYLASLKVARSNDSQLASQLSSDLHAGRTMKYHADQESKVAALTLDEVNAALRKHLEPKRLVIIQAGDFRPKPTNDK